MAALSYPIDSTGLKMNKNPNLCLVSSDFHNLSTIHYVNNNALSLSYKNERRKENGIKFSTFILCGAICPTQGS